MMDSYISARGPKPASRGRRPRFQRPGRGRSARPGCPHTVDVGLVWPVGWGLLVEPLPTGFAVLFTAHNRIDRPVSGQEGVDPAGILVTGPHRHHRAAAANRL